MLIKLGWKNIVKRPLSSGLSMVLLSSSLMIILLSILIKDQLEDRFFENANKVDLVVGAKGSRLQLVLCNVFHVDKPTGNINIKDLEFLSNHPFVKSAIPISLGDSYKTFRIVGTKISFVKDLYKSSLIKGRLFEKSLEVVAGAGVAKKLNLKIGDTFFGSHGIEESLHSHDHFEYKIVGILNFSGDVIDNLLITPLESVWDVHHDEKQKGSFDLRTKSDEKHHHHIDEHTNKKEITSILINYKSGRGKFTIPSIVNKKDKLIAAEPAIEIQQLLDLVQPIIKVINILAFFILGLAIFSIIITLLNSMKDRYYEIAMMRVAGASQSTILITILIEGFIISFLGALIGLMLSHLFMSLIALYLSNNFHYELTGFYFTKTELWVILFTMVIGMISAIFPAITAYKIDISRNLKSNI